MPKLKKHEGRAGTRGVSRARSAKKSAQQSKRAAPKGNEANHGPALTLAGKFPSSGSRTRHALVDDIGNPAVPEQEDDGGAGDLGTTGAVGVRSSRAAKIGIHNNSDRRIGPGNTGEQVKRRRGR